MMMNLSLIVMSMVAVVYAASLARRDLLNLITEQCEHVRKTMSKTKLEKTEMAMASSMEPPKCWNKFFCMAEKSLNETHMSELNKLKNHIRQYNKEHPVNCTLGNDRQTLGQFLNDTEDCAKIFKVEEKKEKKKHRKT